MASPRGSRQAEGAMTTAQNSANTYGGNASAMFSTLAPELESTMAAPPGMNPTDFAAANTAAQQGAGGSAAAGVGAAGLRAARTRNAGAGDAAAAASNEAAGQTLSRGLLGTQIANQHLKESQRAGAQSEMGGLYGTSANAGNQALGTIAPLQHADTAEENASYDWANQLMMPIWKQAAGQIGLKP